ncbi:MAG: hypothetical protein A2091_11410 [Desulfuromonadales bacterium GWD2_61_12]|nr:MAG: hypothetical protein A2005_10145 [Desulfuromonadales bacterium GWC2_61_20]OGR36901.1 MAG: hypothetical protein A2091_11410 [Desulfuromonadales bacterium GWD2_61_12]
MIQIWVTQVLGQYHQGMAPLQKATHREQKIKHGEKRAFMTRRVVSGDHTNQTRIILKDIGTINPPETIHHGKIFQ